MEQLILHLIGDYFLQPHWMANEKTRSWAVATAHGFLYTTPFLLLGISFPQFLSMAIPHAVIDRLRLAIWISKIKNNVYEGDGYPKETPDWLRVWLMIIIDNALHLTTNYLVIRYMA